MFPAVTAARGASPGRSRTRRLPLVGCRIWLGLALAGLLLVSPAHAVVTITLGPGVNNPPPPLSTTSLTPPQLAIADTAALVPVAAFSGILQQVLNVQGFTNANNWTLVTNAVTLNNNATFNITDYHLFLNGAGNAFGENIDFTLNPNLAGPVNPPAGSTTTLHWLQYVNTQNQVNGYGFQIPNRSGFWQMDNGQANGGAAAGAATGPYYDSNADAGFSVPPAFHDAPQFYSGVGNYLHFVAIPTWDVFTPAGGGNPATESIDVANFGLSWGFQIIGAPEPSSTVLIAIGVVSIGAVRLVRRKVKRPAFP
jgi:hypothetical protein